MNSSVRLGSMLLFILASFGASALSAGETTSATAEAADASTEVAAGDVELGKTLYKKDCRGCHGPTAKGVSSYPKLRDHPLEYLVDRLERYRAGEKFGPNTPLMAPRAKKLSDDDILNISTFIVSLE